METYKSNRSERFREWLSRNGMDVHNDKVNLIVDLEKHARLCVHRLELTGELSPSDLHSLVRIVHAIRVEYENTGE